jgi:hypothetical protein
MRRICKAFLPVLTGILLVKDPQARADFLDGNTSQKSFLSDDLFAVVEGHHRTKERCTAIEVRSAWETKILSF